MLFFGVLFCAINLPASQGANDVEEHEQQDDAVYAIEYRDQLRRRRGGREIAITNGGQSNHYKIQRVQPAPTLQPVIERCANYNHECGVNENRTRLPVEEHIQK
jgi:hypothetical protein